MSDFSKKTKARLRAIAKELDELDYVPQWVVQMTSDFETLFREYEALEKKYKAACIALDNTERGIDIRLQREERIKLVRALRERRWPLHAIADSMTAAGIATPQGGFIWQHSTVQSILRSSGGDPVKKRLAPFTLEYSKIMADVKRGIPSELLP